VGCRRCETVCKGECIDVKHRKIDASRCVLCFNCIPACRKNAIVYSRIPSPKCSLMLETQAVETADIHRRQWILVTAGLAIFHGLLRLTPFAYVFSAETAKVSAAVPENLPSGTSRVSYELTHPVFPPGGKEIKAFQKRCTGCHLCVSKCPAGILTPATTEYGINGFLQPVVRFQNGFCNYDCTICTRVCPPHALQPLRTPEEKHQVQIGKVHFLQENCVVNTQGSNCGACGEHCPTGAVKMVPFGPPELFLTIPEIRPELCVGCGACEYICPVKPYKAIYVDGLPTHQQAELAYDPNAEQEVLHTDDFGF
ncbi:MAG: 4Fe-4S binding protein, partial [Planctomycetaceae bacterium]|nr:4Fe-4S binding protein [Planctomycetaceae bacterium]